MLVLCLSAKDEFYNQQVIDADFVIFDKGVTEVWSTKKPSATVHSVPCPGVPLWPC